MDVPAMDEVAPNLLASMAGAELRLAHHLLLTSMDLLPVSSAYTLFLALSAPWPDKVPNIEFWLLMGPVRETFFGTHCKSSLLDNATSFPVDFVVQ
jgi:hypothetical protein